MIRSRRAGSVALSLGALGIVYGDLGTSPLYSLQQAFESASQGGVKEFEQLGIASMIVWVLTIVVTIKYVMVVMRADNRGEGGVLALAALSRLTPGLTKKVGVLVLVLGLAGSALLYGDGLITPAISVLSAVEGLQVTVPSISNLVIPISLVILIGLFLLQRWGPKTIGTVFGPLMLVWFVSIALVAIPHIVKSPVVLTAISPTHAVQLAIQKPGLTIVVLASISLVVTGAEALYADMGQFGKRPIRISWLYIAMPALILNYLGQAALLMTMPGAASSPFFLMVPDGPLRLGMVVLATAATVIASQAIISGVFSLTLQGIHLGFIPRLRVRHLNDDIEGQAYIPAVNWALMVGVIVIVVLFRTSANLSAAFGLAVTGTFIVTTVLLGTIVHRRWGWSWYKVGPLLLLFGIVDVALFTANLPKFLKGGWLPFVVALMVFACLVTWGRGTALVRSRARARSQPLTALEDYSGLASLPITAVYFTWDAEPLEYLPLAFTEHAHMMKALGQRSVILQIVRSDEARLDDDERLSARSISSGVDLLVARVGFRESASLRVIAREARDLGIDIEGDNVLFVFTRVYPVVGRGGPMPVLQQRLYSAMQRASEDSAQWIRVPLEQVLSVGAVILLGDSEIEEVP